MFPSKACYLRDSAENLEVAAQELQSSSDSGDSNLTGEVGVICVLIPSGLHVSLPGYRTECVRTKLLHDASSGLADNSLCLLQPDISDSTLNG